MATPTPALREADVEPEVPTPAPPSRAASSSSKAQKPKPGQTLTTSAVEVEVSPAADASAAHEGGAAKTRDLDASAVFAEEPSRLASPDPESVIKAQVLATPSLCPVSGPC